MRWQILVDSLDMPTCIYPSIASDHVNPVTFVVNRGCVQIVVCPISSEVYKILSSSIQIIQSHI